MCVCVCACVFVSLTWRRDNFPGCDLPILPELHTNPLRVHEVKGPVSINCILIVPCMQFKLNIIVVCSLNLTQSPLPCDAA